MAKKVGRTTERRGLSGYIEASRLRDSILEEESLRRAVASDEELSRTRPDVWRSLEEKRRARNKEIAATNLRLRALGLEPQRLQPSLAQQRQELHRRQKRNVAEIAAFTTKSGKSGLQPRGTKLAGRRSREGR